MSTMSDMSFLLNLLKLSDGIIKDDNVTVQTLADKFNLVTLTLDQHDRIKNNILQFIEGDGTVINSALELAINTINTMNKEYMFALIGIGELNIINDQDNAKAQIIVYLDNTTMVFDNDNDKFNFYSLLVNLTIRLQDIELIEIAILKLESLFN